MKRTILLSAALVAAFASTAAAQSDEWLEQDRRERNAENHKIAVRELNEAVKDIPAPVAGVDKAQVGPPGWCPAQRPGNYNTTQAMDSARAQMGNLERYWMDALLGMSERLCDADPKEPAVQRASAFITQRWMNEMGVSAKDAHLGIRARLDKKAWEAGKKELCEALTVSEEITGPEKAHNAAKRDLFDCGGDSIRLVATAPMLQLVPWLDASGSEPDEMTRLAYLAFQSVATTEQGKGIRDATIVYWIMDQVDYQAFSPDKVVALLGTAPYKGNLYAQAAVREEMGSLRLRRAQIEAEVQKRAAKDPDWKELLVDAPARGIAAWNGVAGKWKAEIARSNEFEQKAYGPSRKALAGCRPVLEKDLSNVLKSYKHDTVDQLMKEINDGMVAGNLISRYIACVAADGDPNVAAGFRQHLRGVRVIRGPRVAAYYAALDALNKIREDRPKFPLEPQALPYQRTEFDALAAEILQTKKHDPAGFSDIKKGVVKAAKKGPKGVTISFNPARRQVYTESCTTTNRIIMFDHSGRPIYDRKCKSTGMQWVDESPDPIVIAADLAEEIKPGRSVVFAQVPYNYGDKLAMPLELYADKSQKKLIGWYGIDL